MNKLLILLMIFVISSCATWEQYCSTPEKLEKYKTVQNCIEKEQDKQDKRIEDIERRERARERKRHGGVW